MTTVFVVSADYSRELVKNVTTALGPLNGNDLTNPTVAQAPASILVSCLAEIEELHGQIS